MHHTDPRTDSCVSRRYCVPLCMHFNGESKQNCVVSVVAQTLDRVHVDVCSELAKLYFSQERSILIGPKLGSMPLQILLSSPGPEHTPASPSSPSRNQKGKSPFIAVAPSLFPFANAITKSTFVHSSSSYTYQYILLSAIRSRHRLHITHLIIPIFLPPSKHTTLTMQLQTLFAFASFVVASLAQASSQRIAFSGIIPSTVHAGTPVNLEWTGGDGSVSSLLLSRNENNC